MVDLANLRGPWAAQGPSGLSQGEPERSRVDFGTARGGPQRKGIALGGSKGGSGNPLRRPHGVCIFTKYTYLLGILMIFKKAFVLKVSFGGVND